MSIVAGISSFTQGLSLVRQRELRRFVWAPLLVSVAIVGLGLALLLSQVDVAVSWIVDVDEDSSALRETIAWFLYLLGGLVGLWLAGFGAILISSPFHGELSAKAEQLSYPGALRPQTTTWSKAMRRAFSRELRKLAYHLPRLLGVALISLIPVVNLAAPVIWLVFGAWTMAVQFCDYATENRAQPFQETLSLLQQNRLPALAFGACVSLAFAVPLLNILMVPAAVIGGTLLWHELKQLGAQRNEAR